MRGEKPVEVATVNLRGLTKITSEADLRARPGRESIGFSWTAPAGTLQTVREVREG